MRYLVLLLSLMAVAALGAQTTNPPFVINISGSTPSRNLSVAGNVIVASNLTVAGIISGNGSGLSNLTGVASGSIFTNNNGQIEIATNAPLYIDRRTTVNAIGADFGISPDSGAVTSSNSYGLAGDNGLPPNAASEGILNNIDGQLGFMGDSIFYNSGVVTNGSAGGVIGVAERYHSFSLGIIGTSFGATGTTNIGSSSSAQGDGVRVGSYSELRQSKSASSRQIISSVILGDNWDTGLPLLTLRTGATAVVVGGVDPSGAFYGNGNSFTNLQLKISGTNGTPPANLTNIVSWINVTLPNGAVYKSPLYQ